MTTQENTQAPRIPFSNPDTEAYWNRSCRHGKYPYPDKNVFLVTGGRFKGQDIASIEEPSVIVALTPELAQQYWIDITGNGDLKIISCISLDNIKRLHKKTEQLGGSTEGCIKIKPSIMHSLFFNQEVFLAVGTDANGAFVEQPVQAATVEEIATWAQQENIQLTGALPLKALSGTLKQMEMVQRGELKGGEKYAYDYKQAEDMKEANAGIASWSIDKRDKADDRCLRLAKNDPDFSKDEYDELESFYALRKEFRRGPSC